MKRNKHSLSNYRLVTTDMGRLVPVGVTEVLPGDTFQHQTSAMIRVSPMQAPVMHPVQVRIHHFFVPNRILWSGWEDFITGGPDGLGSSEDFPTVTADGVKGGLLDYLGVPPDAAGLEVSALPVMAYNRIFAEFYRDQDLVEEPDPLNLELHNVAWEKDYFAAARPFTQKGPDVTLPVGSRAPIHHPGSEGDTARVYSDGEGESRSLITTPGNDVQVGAIQLGEDLYADLSAAEAININDFRLAFALQRYAEARARFGSRFVEYLRYLGVRSSDARLQRPEYLAGGKQTISFSEVLQTASDDIGAEQTPVGTLRGHGIAAVRSNRYRRFFEEHGHVLTLMSIRPKTIYMQAVHKKWLRRTKEDFWQKELERIGQQAVENAEVYGGHPDPEGTFGFVDRYREYREEPSIVTGEFRDVLDYWHLGRDFEDPPVLNSDFVTCVPSKRIHSVQTNDVLWCMVQNSIRARRLVSKDARSAII